MSALGKVFQIVEEQSAKKIDYVFVDMFTASFITATYERLNDKNKKNMREMRIDELIEVAHILMGKTKTY